MELKIRNGDYIADGIGGERRADGAEALLERALFRLSVRRGSFPFLPELGSELYRLGHEKPSARAAAAKLYTAAALAEETALTVEDVELMERGDGVMALRVLLTADGEERQTADDVQIRDGGVSLEALSGTYVLRLAEGDAARLGVLPQS